MNKKQSIGLCSLLLTSVIANAGVSGTVYKDIPLNGSTINAYGVKDANDQGVAGITVTASPSGETTTTAADGTWSLNTTGKVKVEFTNIPSYLKEGAGQSSVQFIDGDASTVDLALFNPSEFALSDKNDIAMTLQPKPTATNGVSIKVLEKDDVPTGDSTANPTTVNDVPVAQTGSIWGLAYDNSNKTYYTSAVVRRHVAVGSDGTGAIYKAKDGVATLFTTVADTGTIPTNRGLSADRNHDPVFNEVGRVGLGDIDMSADGTKLYTINLNTNALIEINIKTKAQTAHNITNPFTGCTDVKSWGIGQNKGKVYVGSVCTTDTAKGAYISEFDGSSFTAFHNIPLNMVGENSLDIGQPGKTLADSKRWGAWMTNPTELFNGSVTRMSLPAPILSDIVFDENDNMIIGFADRTALQAGTNNQSPVIADDKIYKYDSAGDIYKVCKTASGYINEGQANCEQHDADKNGPKFYPEFFVDEEWNGARHKEIALGGLAYLKGSNSLISSAFDPANATDGNIYNTSGLIWMDNTEGTKQAGQTMVGKKYDTSYNGKAGGIGDIELLTPAAPTEIGNRVWFDANANCIQDANESGIAGVEVNLYASSDCTGAAEGTVTTDENGRYLFPVHAGTAYSVCINGVAGQSPLNGKKLTCNDKGTSINNSDATVAGDDAKIALAALTTGANDHSLDFGFTTKDAPTPTPTPENNRTVDHTDGTCDCHSYTEDSTPALSVWSMMILISLTSFMAFLFRKELNQVIK